MFVLQPREGNNIPLSVSYALNQLKNDSIAGAVKLMESVTVKTKAVSPKQKLSEQLSTPLFQPQNEIIFDFVNEDQMAQSYTNIFDWLEGRVAGLSFVVANENFTPPVASASPVPIFFDPGQKIPLIRGEAAVVYINEAATDYQAVNSLPISDIAMVKIFKGYFVGASGGGGGGGVLAIYTKKASLPQTGNSKNPSAVLAGYRPTDLFPPSKYSGNPGLQIKDTRDLFYWTGKATAEQNRLLLGFYPSDVSLRYRLIVTGVTKDGSPVYIEKIIAKE